MSIHRTTDAQIIARGVALLRLGTPLSTLPRRLMGEFGIPAKVAAELAAVAQQRVRKEPQPPTETGREQTNAPPIPDSQIITRALELLQDDLSPSALPERLMDEFKLSVDHADDLATVAIRRRRKQTKPIGGLGEVEE